MAKIIQGNFPVKEKAKGGTAKSTDSAAMYQLKISLLYCDPPIWRRVQVPANMTLSKLHQVIQLSMGWADTHMHQFMIGNKFYSPADLEDNWQEIKALDESKFKLRDLEADLLQRFSYEYDFGDGWLHEIRLETIVTPDEKTAKHPVLLAGERACPPEDIGGPPGYEDFLAAMSDTKAEGYAEMLEWYGSGTFDPDFLVIDEINKHLKKIK